jgi:hypothetical protein
MYTSVDFVSADTSPGVRCCRLIHEPRVGFWVLVNSCISSGHPSDDGELWVWGYNKGGLFGGGSGTVSSPARISVGSAVLQAAAGCTGQQTLRQAVWFCHSIVRTGVSVCLSVWVRRLGRRAPTAFLCRLFSMRKQSAGLGISHCVSFVLGCTPARLSA